MMIEYNHGTDSWTVISIDPIYSTLAGPFPSCSLAIAALVELSSDEPVAVQNDITSPSDLDWDTPTHYPYKELQQ